MIKYAIQVKAYYNSKSTIVATEESKSVFSQLNENLQLRQIRPKAQVLITDHPFRQFIKYKLEGDGMVFFTSGFQKIEQF